MASIAVLGAGIGGLTSTYFLAQQAKLTPNLIKKIYLIERTSRCGGWIASTRFEDGAVYEHGPHTIRVGSNVSRTLCMLLNEIGLGNDILPVKLSGRTSRFICVNDTLYPVPTQISQLFSKMPPLTDKLVTSIYKESRVPKGSGQDESMDSFFRRRFGSEIADYLVGPMCAGVYAADSKLLGIKACFPRVLDIEQKLGSVAKGAWQLLTSSTPSWDPDDNMTAVFDPQIVARTQEQTEDLAAFTLQDGLESLPERLSDIVRDDPLVNMQLNTSVERIDLHCDSSHETSAEITTDAGQRLQVDHIISDLPDSVVARVLSGNSVEVSKLRNLTGQLPFVDVAVVNLEYAGDIPKARGFGYLVPPVEQSPVLGVIFDSCVAPQLDPRIGVSTRLTAMLGGSWYNERLGPNATEDELLQLAINHISKNLHATTAPIREKVQIMRQCIPTFTVGHADRLKSIKTIVKEMDLPISFNGASYDGVAVPDIVHNSIKSCRRLMRKLEQNQTTNVAAKYASQ